MGQTASRRAPEQPPVASSSSTSAPTTPNELSNTSRQQKRSSKSSFRRSLLNVVRPRYDGSPDVQEENPTGASEAKSRRPWRSSRRWSRARPDLDTRSRDLDESNDNIQTSPTTLLEKPSEQVAPLTEPSVAEAHLQPSMDVPDLLAVTNDYVPASSSNEPTITNEPSTSVMVEPIARIPEASVTSSDGVPTPIAIPQEQTTVPTIPAQPQPQARQFPPPGTLVVVQGVVHTSDTIHRPTDASPSVNPERNNDLSDANTPPSISRPPSQAGTDAQRNRLSSLLRPRPISSSNSRPSSIWGDHANPTTPSSQPPNQPSTNNTIEPSPSSTDETSAPQEPSVSTSEPRSPPSPNTPRVISSSSIDVLGTLLSVAAAATAASLLTGSADPIVNRGLTEPSAPLPPASMPNGPLFARPSSTPTPFVDPPRFQADATRSERMRNVWGSFRERFGLRGHPGLSSETADESSDPIASLSRPPLDPRETMLAEMARAFNAGLGLAEPNNNSASDSESAPPPPSPPPIAPPPANDLPPEGSFERFLIDLQVDLRIALTQPTTTALGSDPSPPTAPAEASPVEPEPATVDADAPLRVPSPHPSVHEDDNDDEDLPPLLEVSDSESDDSETEEPPNVHPLDASMADQPSDAGNTTSQSTIPGRINWWRFYRFPAIPAPRPQAAATSPPQSPTILTPPPPTSETPFNNVAAPSTSSSDTPNPSETPTPPPPPTNPPMVIPVVVVGLQSVNTPPTWQPEPSPDEEFLDEGATPGDPDDTPLSHVQEPDPNALPGSADPFNRNVRGRSWHARAANVLRNLRPGGRRSPSPHPRPPSDALGSRTFLIYVIGGYYPPDHNIVTQTFNDFDSFEALLELAELLGQVKPPTVSKEEIDKSNLEIIPASRLSEFEQSGKISSNCVDRCLVCLDDYAPEDNVRVMSCKHAFHKDCVDRWLQTGRNNCPACRSKGIHTEGTPAAAV